MSQFLAAIDENYLSRESRWVDEYPLRGTEVTIGGRKFEDALQSMAETDPSVL